MEQRYGFNINIRDHAGENVPVSVFGTVQRRGEAIDPQRDASLVQSNLYQAANVILGRAALSGEIGLPTLGPSLPHFIPRIEQAANEKLATSGIRLSNLTMQANVPSSFAASAAQGPSPGAPATRNLGENLVGSAAVGGHRIGGGDDLGDQVTSAVKGQLLHYAILGGVALLVAVICCGGVAYQVLFRM